MPTIWLVWSLVSSSQSPRTNAMPSEEEHSFGMEPKLKSSDKGMERGLSSSESESDSITTKEFSQSRRPIEPIRPTLRCVPGESMVADFCKTLLQLLTGLAGTLSLDRLLSRGTFDPFPDCFSILISLELTCICGWTTPVGWGLWVILSTSIGSFESSALVPWVSLPSLSFSASWGSEWASLSKLPPVEPESTRALRSLPSWSLNSSVFIAKPCPSLAPLIGDWMFRSSVPVVENSDRELTEPDLRLASSSSSKLRKIGFWLLLRSLFSSESDNEDLGWVLSSKGRWCLGGGKVAVLFE